MKSSSSAIPALERAQVSAPYARALVETARDLGADIELVAAAAGLDHRRLIAGSEEPVGVDAYLKFLDAAARHLDEPLFGLHAGMRSRVADNRAYALVLMASRTVREVIEQVIRFESLTHDIARTELTTDGVVAHLRLHSPWFERPGGRQYLYYAAAGIRTQTRWLVGADLPMFEFAGTLASPDGPPGAYERILGAPTRWGAPFNEVRFPAAVLDIPIPSADPAVLPALKQTAEARLDLSRRAGEAAYVAQVRSQIDGMLARGGVSLPRVASALSTSSRSLQRHLAAEGVSFSALLDASRRERVQTYLLEPQISLTEIAFLLGYSDQTAFNHAFRGWFGMSPSAWRSKR